MTGAGEGAHLDPAYRKFAALPDDERIAWIRADRWIGFDQAGLALARLENLLTYPPRDRMPCLLIYGDTGMGKTKIIRKFERAHPPKFCQMTGVDHRPVVVAQVPSEPVERDLYRELLSSMGAPALAGGTLAREKDICGRNGGWRNGSSAWRTKKCCGIAALTVDAICGSRSECATAGCAHSAANAMVCSPEGEGRRRLLRPLNSPMQSSVCNGRPDGSSEGTRISSRRWSRQFAPCGRRLIAWTRLARSWRSGSINPDGIVLSRSGPPWALPRRSGACRFGGVR